MTCGTPLDSFVVGALVGVVRIDRCQVDVVFRAVLKQVETVLRAEVKVATVRDDLRGGLITVDLPTANRIDDSVHKRDLSVPGHAHSITFAR